MHHEQPGVTGGVDTHSDNHVAVVVDSVGRILVTETFLAALAGYRSLFTRMRCHGHLERVAVEGTGACGAGLAPVGRAWPGTSPARGLR